MREFNSHIYDYMDYVDSRVDPDYIIYPEADAYYKGSTNYGTDPELIVKDASSATYTRHSYIRFDPSAINTSVESAKIILHSVDENSESSNYQAELVTDNTWNETSINIGYSPAKTTFLIYNDIYIRQEKS